MDRISRNLNRGRHSKLTEVTMTTTPPMFRKLEKASITLADCLACSGCITSAETILVEAQSAQKLYSVFQVDNFSPRSLSSATLHRDLCMSQLTIFQSKRDSPSPPYIVVSLGIQPILSLAHKVLASTEPSQ